MPLQEFWEDEPDLLWSYRSSFIKRKKQEAQQVNYEAWLYGYYNYVAIGTAFSKGKHYLKEPLSLGEEAKDKTTQVENKIKANLRRCKNILERKENQGAIQQQLMER